LTDHIVGGIPECFACGGIAFTFLFRFKEGDKLVRVSMAYEAATALTGILVSIVTN